MKTRIILLIGLIAIILSGCLVKSLHPFYKETNVVFDPGLLGTWLDEDSATWVIKQYVFPKGLFSGDSIDNSYLVEMYEKQNHVSRFNVHLFKLDGISYLDFAPIREDKDEQMVDLHYIPAHSLARIEISPNHELLISWFSEEWLSKLFEENRVKISHEVIKATDPNYPDEYVLTASTDELQKFIMKYGNNEAAYGSSDKNAISVKLKRMK